MATRKGTLPVRQYAVIDGVVIWIASTGDQARALVWDGPGYGLSDLVDGEHFRPLPAGTFASSAAALAAVKALALAR